MIGFHLERSDIYVLRGVAAAFVYTTLSIPIYGVAVRWRANFTPKAVQLEENETSSQNKVTNVFQMMRRVYRVEGWSGLFKGTMLMIATTLIPILLIILAGVMDVNYVDMIRPKWRFPERYHIPLSLAVRALEIALLVPPHILMAVLHIRTITTPHCLPWFKPLRSLRLLFAPAELRRPWLILVAPGIALTVALELVTDEALYAVLRFSCFFLKHQPPRYLFYLGGILSLIISVTVIPAFKVIKTRLSVQPNAGTPYLLVADTGEAETLGDHTAVEVVSFRPDPYLGMVDCAKSIVKEEGCKALFRLWRFYLIAAVPEIGACIWNNFIPHK